MATGKIIKLVDGGSNSNGLYMRFENGIQICSGSFSVSVGANAYAEYTLYYPKAFKSGGAVAPVCTPVIWSDPRNISVVARGAGEAQATIRVGNTASGTNNVTVSWIACGFWK